MPTVMGTSWSRIHLHPRACGIHMTEIRSKRLAAGEKLSRLTI